MKKITLSVLVAWLVALAAVGQHTELLSFTGEVDTGKIEKETMYRLLLSWHREKLPKDALKHADETSGELSGTSFLRYNSRVAAGQEHTQGFVIYDFKVVATTAGFRYIMTNFRHEGRIKFHTLTTMPNFPYKISTVEKPWYDLVWKDLKNQVNQHIPKMLVELQEAAENAVYTAQVEEKEKEDAISHLLPEGLK